MISSSQPLNNNHQLIDDRGLYGPDYFISHYLTDNQRDAMYRQEYARIIERSPHNSAVLDIGCGVGTFLTLFDGWDKFGFEPSEYAADQAKKKNITMVSNLNSLQEESMDLIVFRGTLQHISTPITDIARAVQILKPGGLLAILATPDTDSLVYRLWFHLPALEAERNWVLFGNRFLVNILRRFGLIDIEVLHPYWGTPYARPATDLVKFISSLFLGYRKFAFPGNMMEIYARKPKQG